MDDLSLVQYNLYYLLRELCPDYNIIMAEEDPARITGDTIFLHRVITVNSPLQLGTGIFRTIASSADVFSSNGTIHGDIVSTIMDRFYNAGSIIYDYNPIDGVSNFPYDPPDSDTANGDYTPTVYGWMDFVSDNAQDVLEEEIDRTVYIRTVIELVATYAKE
jgi:hypothetical protein